MRCHSYSSYSTYKQCAAKYNFQYNEDHPRGPMHPAAQRGTDVHNSIDKYMLNESERLHDDIHAGYGQMAMSLRGSGECSPEHEWAVTKDWEETTFKAEDAYIRGYYDLKLTTPGRMDIYEWKTGKVYDAHLEQRYLYGFTSLVLYPEYKNVTVTGVYFDQKKQDPVINDYSINDIEFMKDDWHQRLRMIDREEIWAKSPSFLCRYCDFSKQKGGPCEF